MVVDGYRVLKHVYLFEQFFGISKARDEQIDHIDKNKQNNSISNLRLVNRCQNNQNKSIRKDNRSGATGVTILKNGKFKATIQAYYKKTNLGTFDTFEEAVAARKKAEKGFNSFHDCMFDTSK